MNHSKFDIIIADEQGQHLIMGTINASDWAQAKVRTKTLFTALKTGGFSISVSEREINSCVRKETFRSER